MQPPLFKSAEEFDQNLGKFLFNFKRVGAFNVQRFAESWCDRFGVHDFPRDPRQHLPLLGIGLESASMGRGVRAVWLRTGDQYRIQYSRFLDGRLGLVLWHEFFEILSAHPRFPSRLPPEAEERLATQFAVHVMMPEMDVRRNAAELRHPHELDKTRVLAGRFGVSLMAMRIRLRELGLERFRESFSPHSV